MPCLVVVRGAHSGPSPRVKRDTFTCGEQKGLVSRLAQGRRKERRGRVNRRAARSFAHGSALIGQKNERIAFPAAGARSPTAPAWTARIRASPFAGYVRMGRLHCDSGGQKKRGSIAKYTNKNSNLCIAQHPRIHNIHNTQVVTLILWSRTNH